MISGKACQMLVASGLLAEALARHMGICVLARNVFGRCSSLVAGVLQGLLVVSQRGVQPSR